MIIIYNAEEIRKFGYLKYDWKELEIRKNAFLRYESCNAVIVGRLGSWSMIGIAAEIKKELVLGFLSTHSAQRELPWCLGVSLSPELLKHNIDNNVYMMSSI
jgi:hypothetical protein